ncbi:transposase [Paludifilum halophilum]|uniref:transposase n=1 Tax=Paludifilum halophilum TaxID=1642702 RepID=UPI00113FC7E5
MIPPVAPTLLQQPRHVMVQDRGYMNRERFEEMDDQGVFFVVRLRKNRKVINAQSLTDPAEDSPVCQDSDVF